MISRGDKIMSSSMQYAIKNTYNGKYYQYVGKGCYQWVKSIYSADVYNIENVCIVIEELEIQGIRAIEQLIEKESDEL